MVEEGSPAPTFTLTSDSGEQVSLESFRGQPVVLYFYPRDDTPGCTAQACGIRDNYDDFEERGAVVLGVSPDEETAHVKFKQKYGLPFTLLADPEHTVSELYGVWGERNYMGRTYMGVERSTFLIDSEGRVSKVMRKVKPDTHVEQVLQALPG
ncbi:MAG TPA: thioredoxin-dependent thiol peroxidase [Gaiellaceae bacterium]